MPRAGGFQDRSRSRAGAGKGARSVLHGDRALVWRNESRDGCGDGYAAT